MQKNTLLILRNLAPANDKLVIFDGDRQVLPVKSGDSKGDTQGVFAGLLNVVGG